MSPQIDRRVRRTQAALQAALLALMSEKPYERISVQDIIDRADVGRSTFYSHYTDKKDLFEDGFGQLRAAVDVPLTSQDSGPWRFQFSLPLLQHVEGQREMARILLASDRGSPMIGEIESLIWRAVRRELDAGGELTVPLDALARFVAGGFMQLLEWWLTSVPPRAASELDRMFQAMARATVAAARSSEV